MTRQTIHVKRSSRLAALIKMELDISNGRAKQAIITGKVNVDNRMCLNPGEQVEEGAVVEVDWNRPRQSRGDVEPDYLVYRDSSLLVINKPAGVLATTTGAQEKGTALHIARTLCRGGKPPHVVHRLDKDTSGLMIFARGSRCARHMRMLIDAGDVTRTYFAVVAGRPKMANGTISSALLRDAGGGRRGSQRGSFNVTRSDSNVRPPQPEYGKLAITHYAVVAHSDSHSALEVELETGRTHQIRIHMAELGCPLAGEKVYARNTDASRHALHAGRLAFRHPFKDETIRCEAPWPPDLRAMSPIGNKW